MKHGDAVVGEEARALAEELGIVPDAHMLEHADRDDAVELLVEIAVVEEAELGVTGDAALGGALGRELVLLLREGDAGDAGAAGLGQVEAEAAPARADVEHLHAGLDVELRRQVALLGELGILEGGLLVLEIGAGILPVAVEEEIVEGAREIVVVGDIGLGLAHGIVLVDALQPPA